MHFVLIISQTYTTFQWVPAFFMELLPVLLPQPSYGVTRYILARKSDTSEEHLTPVKKT